MYDLGGGLQILLPPIGRFRSFRRPQKQRWIACSHCNAPATPDGIADYTAINSLGGDIIPCRHCLIWFHLFRGSAHGVDDFVVCLDVVQLGLQQ